LPDRYTCGPLEIVVSAGNELLRNKIADQLELFNVRWEEPLRAIGLDAVASGPIGTPCAGTYLECARMSVDAEATRLVATSPSGSWCELSVERGEWRLGVPPGSTDPWILTDIESLLTLVLTVGWRRLGWVPLHVAGLVQGKRCAVICAESGGGKTSLTAALVRSGWQTLGDDKLLLRVGADGVPELRALVHTFNLHPQTRRWFPEVGDLEELPTYSEWTEKRKVRPETIWPGCTVDRGRPTHLLQIERDESISGVCVEEMPQCDLVGTLLRQTVIPTEVETAARILGTVAPVASSLTGIKVGIGEDAYADPDCLEPLLSALS